MTLTDLMAAVDHLQPDELFQLQGHILQKVLHTGAHPLSPAERIRMMDEAAAVIREGMSPDELRQMFGDMNAEYIEPTDDAQWRDDIT